jgi:carbonic anhydrase
MEKLSKGIQSFQKNYFRANSQLFEQLATGQSPDTMFITCADSRIAPSLLMQAEPGSLFSLRNAGNIVPPYGAVHGGESATIEYAIAVLNIKNIVICGHSQCGAIKALLQPDAAQDLPAVRSWLAHAEATRRIVKENYASLDKEALLEAAIKENVLVQLENLCTHPTVAARLAQGKVHLHGWFYDIKTGEVSAYDPAQEQFVAWQGTPPAFVAVRKRAVVVDDDDDASGAV